MPIYQRRQGMGHMTILIITFRWVQQCAKYCSHWRNLSTLNQLFTITPKGYHASYMKLD